MALTTWTPTPEPLDNLAAGTEFRGHRVQFGDGYSARLADGINSLELKVTLNWRALTMAEKNALVSFLSARAGVEAFKYTLPTDGVEYVWSCQNWAVQHLKGSVLFNLTAELTQEFDPD